MQAAFVIAIALAGLGCQNKDIVPIDALPAYSSSGIDVPNPTQGTRLPRLIPATIKGVITITSPTFTRRTGMLYGRRFAAS